jgi:hypothetical protein
MLPLIGMGIGLGLQAYGAHRANQAGKQAAQQFEGMAGDARSRSNAWEGRAMESRNTYRDALMGFDPQAYMRQAASAAYGEVSDAHSEANRARMTSLNSRGLFGSDLGGTKQREYFDNMLSRNLSGLAMQAGQMEQQRQGALGGLYGMDQQQGNMYYDAATGLSASGAHQRAAGGIAAGQAIAGGGQALFGAGYGAYGRSPAAALPGGSGGWKPPTLKPWESPAWKPSPSWGR